MRNINQILVIILKLAFVLLIPYYIVAVADTITGNRMQVTYIIAGILGYWTSAHSSYAPNIGQDVFWQQNQLLYSILFILPMLLFAYFFSNERTDRVSIGAGLGAVLVSYFAVYLLTPFYMTGTASPLIYLSIPNLISCSMFVFVFWPLLKNSLPKGEIASERSEREEISAKIRDVLRSWFPRNIASLIWICLIIFPLFTTFLIYAPSASEAQMYLRLYGGPSIFTYDYISVASPGLYYPYTHILATFQTAAWATVIDVAIWIANLLLGILTINVIKGGVTKKRFNQIISVVLLIVVIPPIALTLIANLFGGSTGYFSIPLPFYLISMVLVARFGKLPAEAQEDIIKVPLRTRISSFIQRTNSEQQKDNTEKSEERETSDTIQ